MFPSEIEGLQELARLSPAALTVLADRYARLAKACRSRALWLLQQASASALARSTHEHDMRALCDKVRALHRAGLSRSQIIDRIPEHDPAIVRYQYRQAVLNHRKKNAPQREKAPAFPARG